MARDADFSGGSSYNDLGYALNCTYEQIKAKHTGSAWRPGTTWRVALVTDGITATPVQAATLKKYIDSSYRIDFIAFGAHADAAYLKELSETTGLNARFFVTEAIP